MLLPYIKLWIQLGQYSPYLPGSIGDAFVKQHFDYLNSFKEIVYAGELDKTGQKAAERLYKALP